MNIHNLISTVKAHLLSRLPVPIARRYFQTSLRQDQAPSTDTGERQLLVDVSVIFNNDARTGIQRVVRALLLQLLRHPPAGCQVRPVFACRKHGYRYAPDHFGLPERRISNATGSAAVSVRQDDIFLGLDLAAHLLPLHRAELAQWKRSGAEIHIIVYDLLPVLHPQWFNPRTSRNFRKWLRTVAIFADSAICISRTVKTDLTDWMRHQCGMAAGKLPISTIPLGADIQSSVPSRGLPGNIDQILSMLAEMPTILMVGTLEPRKGHQQVLAAFDNLWEQGHKTNLVIVGKPGWKTESLQKSLRTHPHAHTRLHWLNNASDELLEMLYASSAGVIVASEAEGFGLPLIEAMYYNKPVLARDIPVLREIGGDSVSFFASAESLKIELEIWLAKITTEQASHKSAQRTWQESANALLARLALAHPLLAQVESSNCQSNKQEVMA